MAAHSNNLGPMINCEFCGHNFPAFLGRYGCPNCEGEGAGEKMTPIPTPDQIRAARQRAGLSQTAAAAIIHSTYRTWQDWEAGKAKMHPGLWELFTIKCAKA